MSGFEFEVSPFTLRDGRERCEFEALQLEAPPGMPTLRLGSRGAAVADLQRRLAALGLATGTADGIFGSRTDAAVRSFQLARGLGADGIVGAQTWGLLLGTTTPPAPTRPPPSTGSPGQPLVTVPSGVLISDNAVRVLKDILRAAGLTRATVTSGRRTPYDQARIMYELIERHGVSYAKDLYGGSGDQVIDAYAAAKAAGRNATDIKAAMLAKVNQIGCHNVSHHCSDSYDVFDVAPSTIDNDAAFRRALDAALASGAIQMVLSPPKDPAFHIEIALASPFASSGSAELFDETEAMALVEELFQVEDGEQLDLFLGRLVKRVGRAAGGAVRTVAKAARSLPLRDIGNVAFKALRGDVAGILLPLLPPSVQKTVRAFSTDPFARFALQTTRAALRGENVLRAAQVAAKAGIDDVRERMRFAAMVAPFVPGIGSGVAAALGAASALAGGAPITEALISAARSAVPGGAVAQAAFDLGANLARGKSLGEAALATARNQLPGGPAAKAAFDAAVALGKGRKIQDAAFAAAGGVLPKSPFAADALSFARRVAAGEDIRKAALSTAGNAVMNRLQRQGVNVLGTAQRRIVRRYAPGRRSAREAELFELPPLEQEGEFESARRGPTVLPALTIRVRPFVVLDRFAHQSATLPAAHASIVERIARLIVASRLSRQPLTTIRLVGHTDSTGAQPFNQKLGTTRAQNVEAKLRAAIARLGPVPAGRLNIVVQSLGETKASATNATASGRALNRRVEVFLDTTCHSFFAQYDLRFLPGDRMFGIPAHPNLPRKAQREADVNTMAGELIRRRDQRAAAALAGRVPAPRPLVVGTALRSMALRLSQAQLALFREYFDDGRGGIDFAAFQTCFARFANGELRSPLAADQDKGVGEPNSSLFFLFAEFAFLCVASRIQPSLWAQALRAFVGTQEIFMHVYRRSPVSPPPPVGAPLPGCPLDARGRPSVRHPLSSFSNRNFRARGASPIVGVGQSSPARKRALAAKYASATPARLQREAQANLQHAQCMP
jgi:hypothetical protein